MRYYRRMDREPLSARIVRIFPHARRRDRWRKFPEQPVGALVREFLAWYAT